MQVPYLADPNTQVEMFESDDIVHYLRETYGG
jgi:glutathione S-transferase